MKLFAIVCPIPFVLVPEINTSAGSMFNFTTSPLNFSYAIEVTFAIIVFDTTIWSPLIKSLAALNVRLLPSTSQVSTNSTKFTNI